MRYTKNYSDEIERLKKEIASADRIIIGAGAGLSTAAGFTYSGERFERFFSDVDVAPAIVPLSVPSQQGSDIIIKKGNLQVTLPSAGYTY